MTFLGEIRTPHGQKDLPCPFSTAVVSPLPYEGFAETNKLDHKLLKHPSRVLSVCIIQPTTVRFFFFSPISPGYRSIATTLLIQMGGLTDHHKYNNEIPF